MSDKVIVTEFIYPPIPIRNFDWQAHYRGEEDEQMAVGRGATEQAAIDDLIETHPRETCWLIERYITNKLHYWSAGARGRGHADDWATDVSWAVRFCREQDATMVLFHICNQQGRVAEHSWIAP